MSMSRPAKTSTLANIKIGRREIINLAVFLLLLYVVLPQIGKFRASFDVVERAQIGWVVLALGFAVATSFVASITYVLLAKKALRYRRTLAIQFASLFASKLLPAGLGALGLNFEYLRKQRHSRAEAGAVVATNNLLGLVGNLLLLAVIIFTTNVSFAGLAWPHISHIVYWIVAAVVIILIIILAWFKKLRGEVYRTVLGMLKDIVGYGNHPLRLLAALTSSVGLTSLYTACLWMCSYAIGVDLSFGQALVVLSFGVAGSTAIPTPGGLGGAEAGLFAGLIAYRVPASEALAIVLIYRFLTYWLALVFGTVAWIYIRRRNYV